jgi:hypothetical protein
MSTKKPDSSQSRRFVIATDAEFYRKVKVYCFQNDMSIKELVTKLLNQELVNRKFAISEQKEL